jgi:hypothetical protein
MMMLSKEEIQALMSDMESDHVERTVSVNNMDKFGEAVCAFSNDISDHKTPGARPENFPNVSDYRNLILAEAMRVMGFVNRFNRGIATAQMELTENGNREAEFNINTFGVFGVTIWENEKVENGGINNGGINGAVNENSDCVTNNYGEKSGGISGGDDDCMDGINGGISGAVNNEINSKTNDYEVKNGGISGAVSGAVNDATNERSSDVNLEILQII